MKYTMMELEMLNPELFETIRDLEILVDKEDNADDLDLVRDCLFSILRKFPDVM